jgi:hypothetical protein
MQFFGSDFGTKIGSSCAQSFFSIPSIWFSIEIPERKPLVQRTHDPLKPQRFHSKEAGMAVCEI